MNKARTIAFEFFKLTNRRYTPATLKQTISQAQNLLDCGFKQHEILQGIHWCIEHPPPKGFYSIGWLSYDLENILHKIKAKEVQENMTAPVKHTTTPASYKPRNRKEPYDFNILREGE